MLVLQGYSMPASSFVEGLIPSADCPPSGKTCHGHGMIISTGKWYPTLLYVYDSGNFYTQSYSCGAANTARAGTVYGELLWFVNVT